MSTETTPLTIADGFGLRSFLLSGFKARTVPNRLDNRSVIAGDNRGLCVSTLSFTTVNIAQRLYVRLKTRNSYSDQYILANVPMRVLMKPATRESTKGANSDLQRTLMGSFCKIQGLHVGFERL